MMQLERIQAGGTLFKSSCCRTLGLAFLLLAWVWALAPPQALARGACAGETAAVSSSPAPDLRASVLCLVNEARLEHGLPALQQDPRLQAAAQRHTDDMVANHYFAHDSRDGTPFSQRITAAGYQWAATGENIAQGPSTPQLVVQSWIASPVHCRNILAPGFRDLGVGVNPGTANPAASPGTWTQDFGRLTTESAPSTNTTPQAGCPYNVSPISEGPAPTPSAPPLTTDPATTPSPSPSRSPSPSPAPSSAPSPSPSPSPSPAPAPSPSPPPSGLTAPPPPPRQPIAAVTRLRLVPSLFRAARSGASATTTADPSRARVSYELDEPATVRFRVTRSSDGRRVARRCVPASHTNSRRAACIRYTTLRGSFTRVRGAGADAFSLTGRLDGRALRPGSYRLGATPTVDGHAGPTRWMRFRIVR